jgi:LysR family transcriptional regulator, mexEF-oprN operon transcriptional activator
LRLNLSLFKSNVIIINMNRIDVSKLDLNLLRVFVLLMREGSVTRTATRLSLGQPAVSHALARLRELLGDPLFVRNGRSMEATDRARALMNDIAPALETIEGALRTTRQFNPSTAMNIFSIGWSDDVQIALLPKLAAILRNVAPHTRLKARSASYRDAGALLDAGEVSTVLGFLQTLPAQAKIRKLRTCSYRVLRADRRKSPLTLEDYCARDHVLVTQGGDFRGAVDTALDSIGRVRRVAFSIAQFGSLPAILHGTDLLAAVPDYVADALVGFADLTAEPLPFKSPTFEIGLAWRAAADRDPAEIWIRRQLVEILG